MSGLKAGQGEREQGGYKWQQGLQAVNQASNNLVRRSTNESLSAIKEDKPADNSAGQMDCAREQRGATTMSSFRVVGNS